MRILVLKSCISPRPTAPTSQSVRTQAPFEQMGSTIAKQLHLCGSCRPRAAPYRNRFLRLARMGLARTTVGAGNPLSAPAIQLTVRDQRRGRVFTASTATLSMSRPQPIANHRKVIRRLSRRRSPSGHAISRHWQAVKLNPGQTMNAVATDTRRTSQTESSSLPVLWILGLLAALVRYMPSMSWNTASAFHCE